MGNRVAGTTSYAQTSPKTGSSPDHDAPTMRKERVMKRRIVGLAVALATATAIGGSFPAHASEAPKGFKLNVVHGIPGLVVDVCVNGAKPITDFEPGDVVSGVTLPEGEYQLDVTPAGQPCSAAILSTHAELEGGRFRNYTVVANLDDEGTPNLLLFRNATRKTEPGLARLVVRHTADAPAVTVWADGARLNPGREFVWSESRRYNVPAGDYEVFVSLAGDSDPVIGPVQLTLEAGFSYQVYAWGNAADGYAFAVIPLQVGEFA
ncbi:MAG TPA: DUF4397 domain-containing protein [Actinomycetota bacterium]|nr:DUF4397 domain-containing protein [Actinomycetota bacterium]